ncbi:hypothetical protein [Shewanella baltica]|uniref:hypothetical protein n=1 Tax=Shewanella baltica TaxID=62322 RepID=UPI003D795323
MKKILYGLPLILMTSNVFALDNNNQTNGFEICKNIQMHSDFRMGSKHLSFTDAVINCSFNDNALTNSKTPDKFLKMSIEQRINYINSCICESANLDPTGKNSYSFEEELDTTMSNCGDQTVFWDDGIYKCDGTLKAAPNQSKQTVFANQTNFNQNIENPLAMEGQAEFKCENGIWSKLKNQETCFKKPDYKEGIDKVDCVGQWNYGDWGLCKDGFKKRTRQFIVTQNDYNGGKKCAYFNGYIEEISKSCSVKCESYEDVPTFGACENGFTTRSKIYHVISGDCPLEDGEVIKDTVKCSNCQGYFYDTDDWSACNEKGETEVLQQFKVTESAYNGGSECSNKDGDQKIIWKSCSNEPVFDCEEETVAAPFTKKGKSSVVPIINITEKRNDGEIFEYNEAYTGKCGNPDMLSSYFMFYYSYNSEFQCKYDSTWNMTKSECNLKSKRIACESKTVNTGNGGSITFPPTSINGSAFGMDSNFCNISATCNEDNGNFDITSVINCGCKAQNVTAYSKQYGTNVNYYIDSTVPNNSTLKRIDPSFGCEATFKCNSGIFDVMSMNCSSVIKPF